MERLELNYVRPGQRFRRARHILAIAAVAFTLDTASQYHALKKDIASKEERLARTGSVSREPSPAALRPMNPEEYAFARETVGRLSTPWDRLFRALEAAKTDRVALLAIEPSTDQRTVMISGEAKDYLAALSYMASLANQDALRRVHIVRHEPQRAPSPRPLSFTISAAWREER
jgi:hypothetical protein